MTFLNESVTEGLQTGSKGFGSHSRRCFEPGESLGVECPIVAAPAWYSKKTLPCCESCLRHADTFEGVVRFLIGDRPVTTGVGWVECEFCNARFCCECATKAMSSHKRICHKGMVSRRADLQKLDRICLHIGESPYLALLLCASLIEQGLTPSTELFNDPRFEYFNRHERFPVRPELTEACALVSSLLETPITQSFFKRVVDTFDLTNLYLEIENETMMRDLASGKISESQKSSLSETYSQIHYPAIISENHDMFPIPVVIGSGHYPTVAKMNHSCDPNVEWRSLNGSAKIEMVALRPILEGDEILLSYIDQSLPVLERRERLLDLYGFVCECPKCLLEISL